MLSENDINTIYQKIKLSESYYTKYENHINVEILQSVNHVPTFVNMIRRSKSWFSEQSSRFHDICSCVKNSPWTMFTFSWTGFTFFFALRLFFGIMFTIPWFSFIVYFYKWKIDLFTNSRLEVHEFQNGFFPVHTNYI